MLKHCSFSHLDPIGTHMTALEIQSIVIAKTACCAPSHYLKLDTGDDFNTYQGLWSACACILSKQSSQRCVEFVSPECCQARVMMEPGSPYQTDALRYFLTAIGWACWWIGTGRVVCIARESRVICSLSTHTACHCSCQAEKKVRETLG